jgi:DNA-binding HxlR family transcriptional regulator
MGYTNEGTPFANFSDTSEMAAESMDYLKGPLAMEVYEHLLRLLPEGATAEELEVITGLKTQTLTARIRDLYLAGLIYDAGERRKTKSGRLARVNMAWTKDELKALAQAQRDQDKALALSQ